jgi:hypothetical protein
MHDGDTGGLDRLGDVFFDWQQIRRPG